MVVTPNTMKLWSLLFINESFCLTGLKSTVLKELYLNNNRIYRLEEESLIGLFNLQTLRLHDNQISHVSYNVYGENKKNKRSAYVF